MPPKKIKTTDDFVRPNAERLQSLYNSGTYVRVPSDGTLRITGSEQIWNGTDKKRAEPNLIYDVKLRLAGTEADLRRVGSDMSYYYSFANTREGQIMHADIQAEKDRRDTMLSSSVEVKRVTMADLPGLLAASADSKNWTLVREPSTQKGKKASGTGARKGPTVELRPKLENLKAGEWIVVNKLDKYGSGARKSVRRAGSRIPSVGNLPIASNNRETYLLALRLLKEQGLNEWDGVSLETYAAQYGASRPRMQSPSLNLTSPMAQASPAASLLASSPGSVGASTLGATLGSPSPFQG